MFDSHCHLADEAFAADLPETVGRALAAGVTSGLCVVGAGDAGELARARRVAEVWPGARFAVGLHPHTASRFAGRWEALEAQLRADIAALGEVAAIGEIGLDYHYDLSPREAQREAFALQLDLARRLGLPVVIHTREADRDTIDIAGGAGVPGVFHCFSGGESLARAALDGGFHLSFSGMLTFPKAGDLRAVARAVPADRLLVETDCPYLAPVPHRGRRNEPAWIVHTVEALAACRVEAIDETTRLLEAGFARLFGRPPRGFSLAGPR